MTIKEAESLSGVSSRNIRFYEKKGLLSPARNRDNDYREYSEADIQQLKLIRALRMVDMPIEQIKQITNGALNLSDAVAAHKEVLVSRRVQLDGAIRFCDEFMQLQEYDLDKLLQQMDSEENTQLFKSWLRDYFQTTKQNILLLLIGLIPYAVFNLFGLPIIGLASLSRVVGYLIGLLCLALWSWLGHLTTRKWGHLGRNLVLSHLFLGIGLIVIYALDIAPEIYDRVNPDILNELFRFGCGPLLVLNCCFTWITDIQMWRVFAMEPAYYLLMFGLMLAAYWQGGAIFYLCQWKGKVRNEKQRNSA